MSQFPTCPEHQVLKPCPHCEPSKYTSSSRALKTCGDVYQGAVLVTCDCGLLRAVDRDHGHTDTASDARSWYI